VEGEILVQAFIDLSDDMQWEYLIYAKRAWDPLKAYDKPIPRIADPRDYTTAWERARYEHITHIHIQWSEEKKDLDLFKDTLIERLNKDSWADSTLEDFADQLVGTWNVQIGDWSGIFNFAIDGSTYWAKSTSKRLLSITNESAPIETSAPSLRFVSQRWESHGFCCGRHFGTFHRHLGGPNPLFLLDP
jgi:hypothetical protein